MKRSPRTMEPTAMLIRRAPGKRERVVIRVTVRVKVTVTVGERG